MPLRKSFDHWLNLLYEKDLTYLKTVVPSQPRPKISEGSKMIFPTCTIPSSSSTGYIDSLMEPFKEPTECVEWFDLVDICELCVNDGSDKREVWPAGNLRYKEKWNTFLIIASHPTLAVGVNFRKKNMGPQEGLYYVLTFSGNKEMHR